MTFQQNWQRISAKNDLATNNSIEMDSGQKNPKLESLGYDVYIILNIEGDDKQGLILSVIAST